jgi:hypothetical protein
MLDVERSNSLTDLAARIKAEHEGCTLAVQRGVLHAIKCGRLLIEAKDQLKGTATVRGSHTCAIIAVCRNEPHTTTCGWRGTRKS